MSTQSVIQSFGPEHAGEVVGWYRLNVPSGSHRLEAQVAYGQVNPKGADYALVEYRDTVQHTNNGFMDTKCLEVSFDTTSETPSLHSAGFSGINFLCRDDEVFSMSRARVDPTTVTWFEGHGQFIEMLKNDLDVAGGNVPRTYPSIYYHLNSLVLHRALNRGLTTFGDDFTMHERPQGAFTDPAMASSTQAEATIAQVIISEFELIEGFYEELSKAIAGMDRSQSVDAFTTIGDFADQISDVEAHILGKADEMVVPSISYVGYKRDGGNLAESFLPIRDRLVSLVMGSEGNLRIQETLVEEARRLGMRKKMAVFGHNMLTKLHELEAIA